MVLVCGKDKDTDKKVCIDLKADAIADIVFKIMNYNDKGFTNAMNEKITHEHRTLQQNYVRSSAKILTAYCDADTGTDMRNEASKAFACQVKDMMLKKNTYFPFI